MDAAGEPGDDAFGSQNPYIGVKPGSKPSLVQSLLGGSQDTGAALGTIMGQQKTTPYQPPATLPLPTANQYAKGGQYAVLQNQGIRGPMKPSAAGAIGANTYGGFQYDPRKRI